MRFSFSLQYNRWSQDPTPLNLQSFNEVLLQNPSTRQLFLRPTEVILHQCDVFPPCTFSWVGPTSESRTCISSFSAGTLFHPVLRLPECTCGARRQENYGPVPRHHGAGPDKLSGKVYVPQRGFRVPPVNLPPPCQLSNNSNHLWTKVPS